MLRFKVGGMSCTACSARVEKAASAVAGVTDCSVNLLTGDMIIEGDVKALDIISAVRSAGYSVDILSDAKSAVGHNEKVTDVKISEETVLKRRLWASLGLLAILMYFSMGHMINLPLPSFFNHKYSLLALIQMVLALSVMIINKKFFISGFKGVINGAANMDTLVALGSSAAFIYSLVLTVQMFGLDASVNSERLSGMLHGLYFESAAMILALITVGKLLEAKAKGKTTDAVNSLRKLSPKTAVVIRNGEETEIAVSDILAGDIFVVRPSESIAADGIVIEGESAVDESALTGESVPCDKSVDSAVSQGTINKTGVLVCKATADANSSSIERIIEMVNSAAATKAPIARIADKVSGVFVPIVIMFAIITFVCWMIADKAIGFALNRAISVLVISCPCALGLATPVAIMVGSGVAAKSGVLFKNATALEQCGKCKTVILDKTGTVTEGIPQVCDVVLNENVNTCDLLSLALSLECNSVHPLAKAVFEYAKPLVKEVKDVSQFKELSGSGVQGYIDDELCFAGNLKAVSERVTVSEDLLSAADRLSEQGKTPLLFVRGSEMLGIIAVSDTVRPQSISAIKELKKLSCDVLMLTGDNQKTAEFIAGQTGIDRVIAGVLPEGKAQAVLNEKEKGGVIMVGDGINDAIALANATTGMAIGSGTDVSIDSADVVLIGNNLSDVAKAISLSRATLKVIKQNMFWAFFYNCLGIPLAAGVFIPIFNIGLNPMFAAAAMSVSSFCVVMNALRLNLLNLNSKRENTKMKKTISISGMMCGHCSAHVKTALEGLAAVQSAEVSHESGQAIVTLCAPITDMELKSVVESQGYVVNSID